MPDLLLHIGHVKTGSTWLQEAFFQNAGRLADNGIHYPLPRRRDYDRRVPAGNALGLFDDPAKTAARLKRAARPGGRTTLLSSETLFTRLTALGRVDFLPVAARQAGFDRVRILLFVRAPLPLAASIWQQRVKDMHQGEVRDLDTFGTEIFNMPKRVVSVVENLQRLENVDLTFHNYDAHRRDLLHVVEAWLGLATDSLDRPPAGQLNRSLTRAEAALQIAFNRALGPSGDIFAVRLGNRQLDVPPDPPRLSVEVAQDILDRNTGALDRIDEFLPPGEALSRDIPPPSDGPAILNEAQMQVIAEGVASRLRPSMRDRLLYVARDLRRRFR